MQPQMTTVLHNHCSADCDTTPEFCSLVPSGDFQIRHETFLLLTNMKHFCSWPTWNISAPDQHETFLLLTNTKHFSSWPTWNISAPDQHETFLLLTNMKHFCSWPTWNISTPDQQVTSTTGKDPTLIHQHCASPLLVLNRTQYLLLLIKWAHI